MRSFQRFSVYALIAYALISFPLSAVFLKSEYFRFNYWSMLSHFKGKSVGLTAVFCGDSNTAAGRSWSIRIFGHPFASINLAGDGYTTDQIINQVRKARIYDPESISILAGTNDILSGSFDRDVFRSEYKSLIEEALTITENVIVTLIPATSEGHPEIAMANETILDLLRPYDVHLIDLNTTLSENGFLLDAYTVDGVHLNETALKIWEAELASALRN